MTVALAQFQAFQARFSRVAERIGMVSRAMRQIGRWPYRSSFGFLARWQPRMGEDMIVIGAHHGQAIDAIRLYQPNHAIHAFEPNPHLVAALAVRYADDDALALYGCGLSRECGQSQFYIPVYGNHAFDQYGSFEARQCRTSLNIETLAGFNAERLEMMACPAQHFSLDEVEINAGLIVLSETGNNRAILDGARATLKHCAPLVMAPLTRDVRTVLCVEHNYHPVDYRGGKLRKLTSNAKDAIYVPFQRRQSLERAGLA